MIYASAEARMCLGYIWSTLTCQRFGLLAALLAAFLM